jgi:dipeptide/tripeptide permease
VPRLFGVAGAVIGGAILLAFLSGHLRLNIHGFGIVVLAESLWFIGVGALLIRESESGSTQKS